MKFANSAKSWLALLIIKLVNVGLLWIFNHFDFVIDFDKIGCPFCTLFNDEVI